VVNGDKMEFLKITIRGRLPKIHEEWMTRDPKDWGPTRVSRGQKCRLVFISVGFPPGEDPIVQEWWARLKGAKNVAKKVKKLAKTEARFQHHQQLLCVGETHLCI